MRFLFKNNLLRIGLFLVFSLFLANILADSLDHFGILAQLFGQKDLIAIDDHGIGRAVQLIAQLDQRQFLLGLLLLSGGRCLFAGLQRLVDELQIINVFQSQGLAADSSHLAEIHLAVNQEHCLPIL